MSVQNILSQTPPTTKRVYINIFQMDNLQTKWVKMLKVYVINVFSIALPPKNMFWVKR